MCTTITRFRKRFRGIAVRSAYRNTDDMDLSLTNMAARRTDAQQLVTIFRDLGNSHVDQTAVKAALLRGHSQREIAKALGMSKSRVNELARRPWYPTPPRGRDDDVIRRQVPLMIDFLTYVWGSKEAADEAVAVCRKYDRERLPFHFADTHPADWLEQMHEQHETEDIPPSDTRNPPTPGRRKH